MHKLSRFNLWSVKHMKLYPFMIFLLTLISLCSHAAGQDVRGIHPDTLKNAITNRTLGYDLILIDIRTYTEVEQGIIATDYCKPYHLSIAFGELEAKAPLLPKEMPIIIYCRTGTRATDGVNILLNAGCTMIGYLMGGIQGYSGELRDSTEFKPVSALPSPSYTGTLAITTPQRNERLPRLREHNISLMRVTLQGRLTGDISNGRCAPLFILDGRSGNSAVTINGLNRTVRSR